MKRVRQLAGAALALTSAWAVAQEGPESLLPPGFDRPAQRAAPAARAAPARSTVAESPASAPARPAASVAGPVVQPAPVGLDDDALAGAAGAAPAGVATAPAVKLPSLAELERMSPEEFEEVLGLKPRTDMPASARRAMAHVGILDVEEGGMSAGEMAAQNPSLVRAVLAGNKGQLVSRWGHILVRRALASRMDAPAGMDPADFAALRAALLVRMGEGEAARALVQDVDTGNYTPALTQAAFDAYVFTADFAGICPAVAIQGGARTDAQWDVARALCAAFQGDGSEAMTRLDRAQWRGSMPKIDLMLARKYAGATGKARRAVTVDWEGVTGMTPWRYALTLAVGLQPPEALMKSAPVQYDYMAATAPMLGLPARAAAADRAAAAGILSSAAMVDLYGQIFAADDITGDWADRAGKLRDAYVASDPASRLAAMQALWNDGDGRRRYARQVLTAYAAARLPADAALADGMDGIVASMLAAGLDANAMRWMAIAESGTPAWAMLVLAAPGRGQPVDASAVEAFRSDDDSEGGRKSAFLLAGLAGLGRLDANAVASLSDSMNVDLKHASRWSRMIDAAAAVDNQALVALLAGVGMQGSDWSKMTPRHLFHIVSALRMVGLEGEARMIAAEAVARG